MDFDELEAVEEGCEVTWQEADLVHRAARSAAERAKLLAPDAAKSSPNRNARGSKSSQFHGLVIPETRDELEEWGPAWLTRAFKAAGTLPNGIEVTELRSVRCLGIRHVTLELVIDVRYGPQQKALHNQLLVKMSLPAGPTCSHIISSLPPEPWPDPDFAERCAEINCYRLLEEAGPLHLPRYYFGDACAETRNFILITEHMRSPTRCEAIDLKNMTWRECEMLIDCVAAIAGMYKAGRWGLPQLLDPCFGDAGVLEGGGPQMPVAGYNSSGERWLGMGDLDYAVEAARAQEFLLTAGKKLFLARSTEPAAMKTFRTALVAVRPNAATFEWWCRARGDYVVLAPDFSKADAVLLRQGEVSEEPNFICIGSPGVSVGPLGEKIWRVVSCYHGDTIEILEAMLLRFQKVYHAFGGPLLQEDMLSFQVPLQVLLQTNLLVHRTPQLYTWCPKEHLVLFRGLWDPRIRGGEEGQGSIWHFLKAFMSATAVISGTDFMAFIEYLIPTILTEHALGAPCVIRGPDDPPPVALKVTAHRALLMELPSRSSGLICYLPRGMVTLSCPERVHASLYARQVGRDDVRPALEWVRLSVPVPGWALIEDFQPEPHIFELTPEEKNGEDLTRIFDPDTEILALMHHTRRQYTGYTPQGTCITSAMMLRNEVLLRDKVRQLISKMGRGGLQVVIGSFRAELQPRPWWPRGYQDWMHHSFVAFEDGSIADVTADQFDEVPRLWWPADASRYSFDCQKADAALQAREQLGLDRWQELVEKDNTVVARTRQRWLDLERQAGIRPGERAVPAGPASTAEEGEPESAPACHFVSDSTEWALPARPMAATVLPGGVVHLVQRIQLTKRTPAAPGSRGADLAAWQPLRREEFQILREASWKQRIYPTGGPGSIVWVINPGGCPSAAGSKPNEGHGRNWAVEGYIGTAFDIWYDPTKQLVSCEAVPAGW